VEQLALLEVERDVTDEVGAEPLRAESDPAAEQARIDAAAAERGRQEQARVTLAEARRAAEAADTQREARESVAATTAALERARESIHTALAALHATEAEQIFGGLAGALLVEPPTGQGPDLPVTEDRVLLVTDTTLDTDGRVVAAGAMEKIMGRQGELVLLNGQYQPAIPAAPGATQRWRLINGCVSRVLDNSLLRSRMTAWDAAWRIS